jgi:hypothetical protein
MSRSSLTVDSAALCLSIILLELSFRADKDATGQPQLEPWNSDPSRAHHFIPHQEAGVDIEELNYALKTTTSSNEMNTFSNNSLLSNFRVTIWPPLNPPTIESGSATIQQVK